MYAYDRIMIKIDINIWFNNTGAPLQLNNARLDVNSTTENISL